MEIFIALLIGASFGFMGPKAFGYRLVKGAE